LGSGETLCERDSLVTEAVSTSIWGKGDVHGLGFPPRSEAVRPPPSLDDVESIEYIVVREIGISLELPIGQKLELDDHPFVRNSLNVARGEDLLKLMGGSNSQTQGDRGWNRWATLSYQVTSFSSPTSGAAKID